MASSSHISQASILDLRALTAEHVDRFAKEGRIATKAPARRQLQSDKVRDLFDKPSPGLVKRLAAEARNDAKSRHFQDDGGMSDEQRTAIMKAKARKYDAMRRGDFSAMSERELADSVIDFERKWEEDAFSEHSSDFDESAQISQSIGAENTADVDDLAVVEYVDELGRTRSGTRKEARESVVARTRSVNPSPVVENASAYAEVMQSNVIHGDQNFYPVYEPDPETIKAKYRAAEEESRAHHYDSSKEVRARGAGAYQFSLDEEKRAEQMASLDAEREITEQARGDAVERGGRSLAQQARKRKIDDRRALIEAKRSKQLGGDKEVERLRAVRRAAETDDFLAGIEQELKGVER